MKLQDAVENIVPPNKYYIQRAQERLDCLAIPRGSLGRLMELGRQFAGIQENATPKILKKKIFTFAADHGVVEQGVSAFPSEVTRQMVYNFIKGGASINVLARHAGAVIEVVDIGVNYDFQPTKGLTIKKIAKGTKNMAKGPAMSRAEAVSALEAGIELACNAGQDGVSIIGTGDMGIGNTTPSSAITAVLCDLPPELVTSRGTGVDDERLKIKINTIKKAISLNKPDRHDPVDVLSKIGGFEIAGIAGLILGSAAKKIPVVIDGFISTAGALIAYELKHEVVDYIFASHLSVEKGHRIILDRMGLKPLLDLDMRLGEGTGAALGISLVEAGVKILTEVLTFEEAGITEGQCNGAYQK